MLPEKKESALSYLQGKADEALQRSVRLPVGRYRDLVGRKLDIQFDPVSGIYCSLKGGKGVFRNLMVIIMQSPVGKKCAEKGGAVCAADSGVHQKHIQRGEADEDL